MTAWLILILMALVLGRLVFALARTALRLAVLGVVVMAVVGLLGG